MRKSSAVHRIELNESGFTLMEIVLAMAILSLMLTVAYSALRQISASKRILDDRRESGLIGNAVLSRITRELQLAQIKSGPNSSSPLLFLPDEQPPGVTGSIYFFGERAQLQSGERGDRVTFVASEGGQYLPDGGTHSGIVQINYRVEEAPPEERSETYYLVRSEIPYIRDVKKAYEKILTFPVTSKLVSLEFSYYDGDKSRWVDEWGKDTSLGATPLIIEYLVKIQSPEGNLESFGSSVALTIP